MDTAPELMPLVSVAIGLGLAAAAGFRVFVPLLALGLASRQGLVPLAPGSEWIASPPALIAFGTATVVEVLAYHVPFLDHLLDVIATPSAIVAGTIASAAVLTDLPPVVKWSVAVLAGGGAAGLVQTATVLARVGSTTFTGGLGNVLFASFELFGAVGTVVLAIALPMVALGLLLLLLVAAAVIVTRVARGKDAEHAA